MESAGQLARPTAWLFGNVPEARRLLHPATTPITAAARQLGYAWSGWRRKHQARARYHQARLRAAQA